MGFEVKVLPSNRVFTTDEDSSILQSAIAAGVGLPYGCQDGACGSCKCKLITGEVRMDAYQYTALKQAEREQGYILTCRAHALSNVELESTQVVSQDMPMPKKMPVRVSQIEKLCPDVVKLIVQFPATTDFSYLPGQYIEFVLGQNSKRAYSIANAQVVNQQLELHIRHMPGGKFTDHVFTHMKEKEILRMQGPYGSFYWRQNSNFPIVLLASGTGFAPIKAIMEQMLALQHAQCVYFYWGARRPQDLYMQDWLDTYLQAMPHVRYQPVVSDALPEDNWQGRTGLVHEAVMQDFANLSGFQVYACGAPVMVNAAQRDFVQKCNLAQDAFFADAFVSQADMQVASS